MKLRRHGQRMALCVAMAISFRFIGIDLVRGADQPSAAATPPTGGQGEPIDFARDIRPLFASKCFDCHGPASHESGLRLSRRDAAFAGGDSGKKAIVPREPNSSRLLALVRGDDPKLRMPPEEAGDPLTDAEIELLTRWIGAGAAWPAEADLPDEVKPHWAWSKPVASPTPRVAMSSWPRNEIDYFVLERLERERLSPSAEADRYTLARRVALDLTGLPPTPEQLLAYARDDQDGAYERLVDQLLESPAYGERWARLWLDLARYADSKGYGSDPLRTIWGYRDWVIEAFNRNLPYDQFTIDQLAGDLAPNATNDQILATAFHRNTMANDEGGTDDEEFRVAAVKDRVDATGLIWMGITIGCAKCHTHKFDPISQREYYQFFAFFNQTADADRPDEEPRASLPTLSTRDSHQQALASVARAKASLEREPANVELQNALKQAEAELEAAQKQFASTPIMRELPLDERRTTHILVKSNFLLKGDVVIPGVPAAFHPLPSGAPLNRLGLARWLVDPENPLTARVAVNRFWAQLFGRGLVETEEDFGTQGLPPSHPELLDHLAVRFMREGWNIKRLLKLMVTSSTYRQASSATAEQLQFDRANRTLARGPAARLEAEMIRDQALAISGLLSRKLGGPSVFPPQPAGLWRAAFNGERTWATSEGEDRYRRGIYTFWRRTIPYPAMAIFDAPSREICSIKRIATNTPLQAFVGLNDPAFIECAQSLARRTLREAGPTSLDRARHMLTLALCRPIEDAQAAPLVRLYELEAARYRSDPAAATQIATAPLGPLADGLDVAEAAAWTLVANVVLNHDGLLTKR